MLREGTGSDELCSLTKIYTDLCECCARPKGLCRRTDRDIAPINGDDTLSNRFSNLDVGDVGAVNELADNQRIKRSKNLNLEKEESAAASTPRLVDDALEEVFGLWKDIQVSSHRLTCCIEVSLVTSCCTGGERVSTSEATFTPFEEVIKKKT